MGRTAATPGDGDEAGGLLPMWRGVSLLATCLGKLQDAPLNLLDGCLATQIRLDTVAEVALM